MLIFWQIPVMTKPLVNLEHSKNIPGISVSKIFQGYLGNIVKLQKYFHKVKKFTKLFYELSCVILIMVGSLLS